MRFGADYYPEHWPESRWATDAGMMRDAGFNVVRLAEFAWSKLEPEEGVYDFDWLDRATALLGRHGMAVVLGTPTAIPPDWLTEKHPEILPIDARGMVRREGTRRHYRFCSDIYRAYCSRIVKAMAARYKANPDVIGWQIDNEWGCHGTTYEYSEESRGAFQQWLKAKYGTLEELNRRWGTIFWSQTFHSWEAVPLPWYAPADHNPSLSLDFRRWSSTTVARFQKMQVEILRQANPNWFITHNFMGLFDEVDGEQLSVDLDFASWDNYPITTWGGGKADPAWTAFAHDVTRGFKQRNFWVMEQQAGPTGSVLMSPAPRPGQIPFLAWQAIAHGADGIVFFRWRTCLFGAEQYWHGILDHHGEPRRRYREVAEMGAKLARIGPLLEGTTTPAQVALLRDFDSCWAYRIQEQTQGFSYDGELGRYHAALRAAHLPVDVVSSQADLSSYKLVLAPCLHLISEETAAKLRAWVEQGGVLLGAYRFGVKDPDNQVVERPLPGLLADLFGVEVEEYDPMGGYTTNLATPEPGETGSRRIGGESYELETWADLLRLTAPSATVLARYGADCFAGGPAVAMNRYGRGAAVYVGSSSRDPHFYAALVELLRETAGLEPIALGLTAPSGVEIAPRRAADGRMLFFVLNSRTESIVASGTSGVYNHLSDTPDTPLGESLELPAWGVALLERR